MPPHYRRPADAAIPTPIRAVSFVLRAPPTYLCIYGGEKLDMGGGGFPIDLVLFGMIAAFLVLRLRSILGKRTGFERQTPPIQPVPVRPAGPIIEAKAEPPQPASAQTVPDGASPVGQALAQMR